jgi:hypothetical protein
VCRPEQRKNRDDAVANKAATERMATAALAWLHALTAAACRRRVSMVRDRFMRLPAMPPRQRRDAFSASGRVISGQVCQLIDQPR